MKNLLLATTVAIAAMSTGFAASAQVLSDNVRLQIVQLVPDADLTNLSTDQIAELEGIFSGPDSTSSGANPRGAVMQVLDGSSARAVSQFQLSGAQKTQIRLVLPEVAEADLDNLSTAQMAQITGLFTTDGRMTPESTTGATLKAILMDDGGPMIAAVDLSEANKLTIMQLVPDANLDLLTTAQVAELTTFMADSGNLNSGNNPAGRIRAILGM